MSKLWDQNIDEFISLSAKYNVRMLMVGGGAVNFHGYKDIRLMLIFGLKLQKKILKS